MKEAVIIYSKKNDVNLDNIDKLFKLGIKNIVIFTNFEFSYSAQYNNINIIIVEGKCKEFETIGNVLRNVNNVRMNNNTYRLSDSFLLICGKVRFNFDKKNLEHHEKKIQINKKNHYYFTMFSGCNSIYICSEELLNIFDTHWYYNNIDDIINDEIQRDLYAHNIYNPVAGEYIEDIKKNKNRDVSNTSGVITNKIHDEETFEETFGETFEESVKSIVSDIDRYDNSKDTEVMNRILSELVFVRLAHLKKNNDLLIACLRSILASFDSDNSGVNKLLESFSKYKQLFIQLVRTETDKSIFICQLYDYMYDLHPLNFIKILWLCYEDDIININDIFSWYDIIKYNQKHKCYDNIKVKNCIKNDDYICCLDKFMRNLSSYKDDINPNQ